ncbi:hypothetical protein AVEN_108596-1 [Araneus ventricosus]|uniref:Uncharacterized protein n=1 Tax=Araneus ventricosus TaxID=182803 RepID=A0A4Y2DH13_ARAVE|nr:hypothetical protein AVEN_108596-1 [Araneus ventricosus]
MTAYTAGNPKPADCERVRRQRRVFRVPSEQAVSTWEVDGRVIETSIHSMRDGPLIEVSMVSKSRSTFRAASRRGLQGERSLQGQRILVPCPHPSDIHCVYDLTFDASIQMP